MAQRQRFSAAESLPGLYLRVYYRRSGPDTSVACRDHDSGNGISNDAEVFDSGYGGQLYLK